MREENLGAGEGEEGKFFGVRLSNSGVIDIK